MFRKLVIALGATAVIGAAAFAPTAASAKFKGGNWHHGHGGFGIVIASPVVADDCYTAPQKVWTNHGWRTRYVEVCD